MKEKSIKSKRLIISPMSDSELENKISSQSDEHLKAAYSDMLKRCVDDDYNRYWNTLWTIKEKSTMNEVGNIGFLGTPESFEVKIGYGIDKEYQSLGYATEAVKKFCDYAFEKDESLYFISSDTEKDNTSSQNVLAKCKFKVETTNDDSLLHFVLARPITYWIAVFLFIGLSMGVAIGVAKGVLALSLPICMCIGLIVGAIIDSREKKKVSYITTKRGIRINSTVGNIKEEAEKIVNQDNDNMN